GAFSKVKDGLAYDRFRRRGMKKIVADMMMVAMAINLNKLHSKIQNNQTGIIEYKKAA
ncbi:transposase, partial [Acidaminobacter hydrogenoformans]